jgi:hypothetical protein
MAKKKGAKKSSSKLRLVKEALSVYLDKEMAADLREVSKHTGLTQQFIIRAALKQELAQRRRAMNTPPKLKRMRGNYMGRERDL